MPARLARSRLRLSDLISWYCYFTKWSQAHVTSPSQGWAPSEEGGPRLLQVVEPVLKVVQSLHLLLHRLARERGFRHGPLGHPSIVVLLRLEPYSTDHQEGSGVRHGVLSSAGFAKNLALLLPVVPARLSELLSLNGGSDLLL